MEGVLNILAFQSKRMPLFHTSKYLEKEVFPTIRDMEPDIVVMPEKWVNESLCENSSDLDYLLDPFLDLSTKNSSVIVPGSFSLIRGERLFNSSPAIFNGKIIGWQDKISLFRDEKKEYTPGDRCMIFDANNLKFSISVCYDSDFPYYARIAANKGSEIMLNPALIHMDFHDMWQLYIEARALENRLPFVAVNSISEEFGGNSIVTQMERYLFGVKLITRRFKNEPFFTMKLDLSGLKDLREERLSEDPGIYGFPRPDK